jgi:hypothetical protein
MKTPYSHVYIKFKAETLDRTLIYEAVGGGVRFIGSKRWEEYAKEVASFELDITDESYYQIMRYCVDNSGIDYGFWQNIGVVISNIFSLKKNPFSNGENCSEAIGEILGLEGYKIDKDMNLLTPKDIFSILIKKTT